MDNVFLLFSFFSIHLSNPPVFRVKVHFDSRFLLNKNRSQILYYNQTE